MVFEAVTASEIQNMVARVLSRLVDEAGTENFILDEGLLYHSITLEEKFPDDPQILAPIADSLGNLVEDLEFLRREMQRDVWDSRGSLRRIGVLLEYLSYKVQWARRTQE